MTQGQIRSDEMVISAPPLEMQVEFAGQLGHAPRTTREWGEATVQGEIEAFDESSLNTTGEPEGLQSGGEGLDWTAGHLPVDADEPVATMNLLNLGIEQARQCVPDMFDLTCGLNPH